MAATNEEVKAKEYPDPRLGVRGGDPHVPADVPQLVRHGARVRAARAGVDPGLRRHGHGRHRAQGEHAADGGARRRHRRRLRHLSVEPHAGIPARAATACARRSRRPCASPAPSIIFTGITLAIGVVTWVFSPLQFQADIGIMLTFMFFVNMLGAIILLPALAAWLVRPKTSPDRRRRECQSRRPWRLDCAATTRPRTTDRRWTRTTDDPRGIPPRRSRAHRLGRGLSRARGAHANSR